MKKNTDTQDEAGEAKVKAKGGGSKRRQEAVDEKYQEFSDLFEKKGRLVRIKAEWQRLISSMIYQDVEEEAGFDACMRSFVNGLIWQNRREGFLPRREAAGETEKADPSLRPELQKLIDEIVTAEEQKNGSLQEGRQKRRTAGDADASLLRLSREEIRDFMRCIHTMRDSIQPTRLSWGAISKFMTELLWNLPVYEACMESFRAGIIFQMHRMKLEGPD